MIYGSEAWDINEQTAALINGANSRLLSRFTGKDAHTEASSRTRTYDLVGAIRKRRFKWLGHILRLRGDRLIKLSTEVQFRQGLEGGMFMDLPEDLSYQDVVKMA